jgi:hypothetical protein
VNAVLPISLPQQKLFMRLRATDPAGNVSVDSDTRTFEVFIGTKPAASSMTADTTPTFTWVAIRGVTNYLIQVDSDGNFATSTYSFPVTGVSYTLTNLQALTIGAYAWRVVPDGDTSSTGSTRTMLITPLLVAPKIVRPIDGLITRND